MTTDNDINHRYRLLIDQYGKLINKVCYMYADCIEDFEDLRQETFINLWRGMDSFRGDAEITTWVYRVALNSCVYNPEIQKSAEPDTKGSKSSENLVKTQFQRVTE